MKITENKLRSIIRKIILEYDSIRDRLMPIEKTGDRVYDAIKQRNISKVEMDELNRILSGPEGSYRDEAITNFNVKYGFERFEKICSMLDLNPYSKHEDQYAI